MQKENNKDKKIILGIIIGTLIPVIIVIICLVVLSKNPKITYKYYINNNKSSYVGNNIANYECNNGVTLDINKEENTYTPKNLTKNSSCTIYYEDTAGEQLMDILLNDENQNDLYLDSNNILRYTGENPNNYVYFNCDNQSDTSTCELWRVVSVTKSSDLTKKNSYTLKIVKDTPMTAYNSTDNTEITEFSWNNNRGFNILEASLYDLLNNAYYNSLSNYTYKTRDNNTVNLDFSKTGLKNDLTRNYIKESTWRINANTSNNQVIQDWYSDTETGNIATFKVGLTNISDYILALKDNCKDTKINEFATCSSKSYLSKENGFFVLDSYQEKEGYVYRINGDNAINAIYPTALYNIYPSFYLDENIKIVTGDGSKTNPYQLS